MGFSRSTAALKNSLTLWQISSNFLPTTSSASFSSYNSTSFTAFFLLCHWGKKQRFSQNCLHVNAMFLPHVRSSWRSCFVETLDRSVIGYHPKLAWQKLQTIRVQIVFLQCFACWSTSRRSKNDVERHLKSVRLCADTTFISTTMSNWSAVGWSGLYKEKNSV